MMSREPPPTRPDVIVADDDSLVAELVELSLSQASIPSRVFSDGDSAFGAAMTRRPALLILDIEMPGLSGLDVVRRLRGLPRGRDLPVLMLTGRRRPEQILEARSAGISHYMTKPFDPGVLVARAQHLMRAGAGARRSKGPELQLD